MSTLLPAPAKATASCRRCNRRKKKCDRTLPECETCRSAQIACSFLSDERQVGSYPVAYVQSLESRVKELENRLSNKLEPVSSQNQLPDLPDLLGTFIGTEQAFDSSVNVHGVDDASISFEATDFDESAATALATSRNEQADALVDGIRVLSLEATAERYLGSASGLSFAKLTQTVLRRLSPNKAEFAFSPDQTDNFNGLPAFDDYFSSDMLLDPVTLLDFSSPQYNSSLFSEMYMDQSFNEETVLENLCLPDKAHIEHLTDFYFAHSHTLYPILRRADFLNALWTVYNDHQSYLAQSSLWNFRIWMVLAVGSTAYHTITLVEESESVLYYKKAMLYFEAALGHGDMAALEVLMLQVSYSFFNQIGPNTWFLVGIAARIAIGIGLHSAVTYQNLTTDVAEHRKRLFYSLYMMDRVVSSALGRPFAVHDQDIDVAAFSDADEASIKPDGILLREELQPSIMSVPLHILALRKIAGEIADTVYSKNKAATLQSYQGEDILESIHKKLIKWRREMPFPLPDIDTRVPHLCSSWYDLNYYTHVARLYRPSPICPVVDARRLKILTNASAMSIRQAINLHRQQRLAYNWLNLLEVFTITMSLIYATTAQPDDLTKVLMETKAIKDIELAIELFNTFGKKFSIAQKIVKIVEDVLKSFKDHFSEQAISST